MEKRIKAGVLTISDKASKGLRTDESGKIVLRMLEKQGFSILKKEIVPDDRQMIAGTLIKWVEVFKLSLIITSGGTGLSPRDITPQVMKNIIDYEVPGMAEAMRAASLKKTPNAMLSRAMTGVRQNCLIINLPGSPVGAGDNLSVVLPSLRHALAKLAGDMSDCAG